MGWSADAPDAGWALEDAWPEAAVLADAQKALLLTAAGEQCEAFAPSLPEDAQVPVSWRLAVVMQARALYQAGLAGAGDQIGVDGIGVQVFPMSWHVKRLLRPQRVPVVA